MGERNQGGDEDEDWEYVTRRRRRSSNPTRKNMFDFANATTFFVSNLPNDCSRGEVRNEFRDFGDLVDVFIPKKPGRGGYEYAFIRYENVGDMTKLIQELNMVEIRGAKLSVDKAKFKRDGMPFDESKKHQTQAPGKKVEPNTPRLEVNRQPGMDGEPLRDAASGSDQSHGKSIEIPGFASKSLITCFKNSLLVEAKDLIILCNLLEIMKNVNHYVSHLRYVGGLKFLMSFYNETQCEDVYKHYQTKESKWFTKVERWKGGDDIVMERIAWLKICGVPIHLWDKEVFNHIGGTIGRLMTPSMANPMDYNLSFEVVGVLVKTGREINEEIDVISNGIRYPIWISEIKNEWVPNFLKSSQSFPIRRQKVEECPSKPVVEQPPHNMVIDLEEGEILGNSAGEVNSVSNLAGTGKGSHEEMVNLHEGSGIKTGSLSKENGGHFNSNGGASSDNLNMQEPTSENGCGNSSFLDGDKVFPTVDEANGHKSSLGEENQEMSEVVGLSIVKDTHGLESRVTEERSDEAVSTSPGSPLPFSLSYAPKCRKKARPNIDHLDLSLSSTSEIYNLSNPDVPLNETMDVDGKEKDKIKRKIRQVKKGVKVSRFKVGFLVPIAYG